MLATRCRLLVALALGANIQAFVIVPQHRLRLPSSKGGQSCSPLPAQAGLNRRRARGGDGDGRRRAVPPPSISMRAGRSAGDVSIEGAAGETRRVKRSRRPDMQTMQQIGIQAAAVATLAGQETAEATLSVAEQTKLRQEQALRDEEDLQVLRDVIKDKARKGEPITAQEKEILLAGQRTQSQEALSSQDAVREKISSGEHYDKHLKIYRPMKGLQITKTYGFWTWQAFGFYFLQGFARKFYRKGGSLKKLGEAEINWEHIVTEPEHLKELKAFCCEECGYTLFPARGRHERFFDDVEDYKCPECDAPRSAFYDANDPDDPHNQAKEDGGGAAVRKMVTGDVDSEATSTATKPVSTSSTQTKQPGAKPPVSKPKKAPEEPSENRPAKTTSEGSPNTSMPKPDDDDADDDLLDF